MSDNISAEIVAIGTEILLGEITDTNSVFIAQEMRDMGINVFYMTSVGDNKQRIADVIANAMQRADIVITCGGLGPTVDDMTRDSIALATERELEFHQSLYDQIAARFATYNVTMPENNRRQAFLPAEAITIENPVGTAPSFIVEHNNNVVISLPGVPREMKFLMTERVVPYLLDKYDLGIIKARILKTAGIGESTLDEMLGAELLQANNPTVGLAAHHGVIDIRMTAKANSSKEADNLLDITESQVRAKVGQFIFGTGEDTLEKVVLQTLVDSNIQLSILEAGITNALISKLKLHANDSTILNEIQQYNHPSELGDYDLRTIATQRAEQMSSTNNAAIAIVSLPDVDENADIEVATAVAVSLNGETSVRSYGFGGKSPLARDWVSRWTLAKLWRTVKEHTSNVE